MLRSSGYAVGEERFLYQGVSPLNCTSGDFDAQTRAGPVCRSPARGFVGGD